MHYRDVLLYGLALIGLIVSCGHLLRLFVHLGTTLQILEIRLRQRKRLDRALVATGLSPITKVRQKQLGEIDELEREDLSEFAIKRRIVCSANLYEGRVLVLGIRHCDGLMNAIVQALHAKDVIGNMHDHIQGFVDNKGQFLTREEAWDVATEAGQILRRCGGDGGRLYSENIY